jgi:uncharacterized membrane protein YbhN (UPF0104 family)
VVGGTPAEASPEPALEAGGRPPSLTRRLASPRTALSMLIAFGLLAFLLNRLGAATLAETVAMIRGANPLLYLAAIGTYYLAFPIRAARWQILLANSGEPPERIPSVRDLAEIIYLSWFANSILPAKLGDVYRGWLLRRTGGVTWSHAMGTIVAERVLDLIVLVTLMVTTGFLTYSDVLSEAMRGGPLSCLESGLHPEALSCTLLQLFVLGGIVALVLLVGLIAFARFGGHAERFLPGRVGDVYVRFSSALVLSFGRFRPLLALSALAWVAEGGSFWLIGRSLGIDLPLPLVVFFSLLQAFLTAIPLTPGGVGFAEIILSTALVARSYADSAALAMTAVYRSISWLSLVLGGAVVYVTSEKTK